MNNYDEMLEVVIKQIQDGMLKDARNSLDEVIAMQGGDVAGDQVEVATEMPAEITDTVA